VYIAKTKLFVGKFVSNISRSWVDQTKPNFGGQRTMIQPPCLSYVWYIASF